MNRKKLCAAILVGLAEWAGLESSVQVVYINNQGLGQIPVYPLYTSKLKKKA